MGSDPSQFCTVTDTLTGVNPGHRFISVISFTFSDLYNGAVLATGVVT
jgi:hypothetical protein